MDENLRAFLLSRSIPEETLHYLESEKIDANIIQAMTKYELGQLFPKKEDQLAVANFVQKIYYSKKRNKKCPTNVKNERQIEVGWLLARDDGVLRQVRSKLGGGNKKITVSKELKKEGILKHALDLFFPNGENRRAKLSDFKNIDLLGYRHNSINDTLTLGDMYNLSGLPMLRFYLATTHKAGYSAMIAELPESEDYYF